MLLPINNLEVLGEIEEKLMQPNFAQNAVSSFKIFLEVWIKCIVIFRRPILKKFLSTRMWSMFLKELQKTSFISSSTWMEHAKKER